MSGGEFRETKKPYQYAPIIFNDISAVQGSDVVYDDGGCLSQAIFNRARLGDALTKSVISIFYKLCGVVVNRKSI